MALTARIDSDLVAALKAGQKERLWVLRTLKARLQEAEVALRGQGGREARLDDAQATAVLAACAKQRRDSIASYRSAGREDRAAVEEAELVMIQEDLPAPMTADALRDLVRGVIVELGAASPKDMGRVMQAVMPRLGGVADGKEVARLVQEILQGG
jgi:uncharacterized protein YqeY